MFDPTVYSGSCRNGPFCEIMNRADVSQLNALQLHHSREAVYFANPESADYVKDLYEVHRSRL